MCAWTVLHRATSASWRGEEFRIGAHAPARMSYDAIDPFGDREDDDEEADDSDIERHQVGEALDDDAYGTEIDLDPLIRAGSNPSAVRVQPTTACSPTSSPYITTSMTTRRSPSVV